MQIKYADNKYFVIEVTYGNRVSPECETYYQAKVWMDKIRQGN